MSPGARRTFRWDRLFSAVSSKPTMYGFVRQDSIVWVLRSGGVLRIDLDARRELPAARAAVHPRRRPGPVSRLRSLHSRACRQRCATCAWASPCRRHSIGELSRYRSRLVGIDPDWSD
jgi:hypothetical protein